MKRGWVGILVVAVVLLGAFTLVDPNPSQAEIAQLVDRPVPTNLIPPLTQAGSDRPLPYNDRCHVQQNMTSTSTSCLYGDKNGKKSIILFGDSHALSWFSPIEKLATIKHWKFYSLTMSSCWPADIPAYNSTTNIEMKNCPIWRSAAFTQMSQVKPFITFVTGTRGFTTINDTGTVTKADERLNIWREGIQSTLGRISSASKNTVYLADTPNAITNVNLCLQKNPQSILKCSNPISKAVNSDWIAEEKSQANIANVIFVDPTNWICDTDPCSPISGRYLKYFDAGHFSATYMRLLEGSLWREINTQLRS